jgi:hypothetical protein
MLMIQRRANGWSVTAVAQAQGVTTKTVREWRDRSSRPHRSPTRLNPAAEQQIETLRRQRMTGPAIARRLGRPLSTVRRRHLAGARIAPDAGDAPSHREGAEAAQLADFLVPPRPIGPRRAAVQATAVPPTALLPSGALGVAAKSATPPGC